VQRNRQALPLGLFGHATVARVVRAALDYFSCLDEWQRPLRHSPLDAHQHHRYGAPDATKRGRGRAVAVVDTEYEVSFRVLLPFAFATSQVPILDELRFTTERSTFPDGACVGVDPRRQLLSKALALRVESEAQAACLRRAGDVQAEPCGVVAVLAGPNLIAVHPR